MLIPPPSRRISAFVLAILLLSISKSALLVTGMTCGAKNIKAKKKMAKKSSFFPATYTKAFPYNTIIFFYL